MSHPTRTAPTAPKSSMSAPHASVGVIGSSEDLLEIDFAGGKITQVGDQYGIGRR